MSGTDHITYYLSKLVLALVVILYQCCNDTRRHLQGRAGDPIDYLHRSDWSFGKQGILLLVHEIYHPLTLIAPLSTSSNLGGFFSFFLLVRGNFLL